MRIVVDCAHGATYHIAGHVLHELGADVVVIGAQPDGLNINQKCGAMHSTTIQKAVKQHHADIGIALDGDGDRMVMSDNNSVLYDGDQLLYIIARHRQQKGLLKGGVVGTLMTNLAIENGFNKLGIPFARANVGDRNVLELLQKKNWELGGEGSGHIICVDKHTTGDGIISALQILHAMRGSNKTLAELSRGVTLYPQQLINVKVQKGFDFHAITSIKAAQTKAKRDLGDQGRILLRASGTEPLVRVMVEGKSKQKVKYWVEYISNTLRNAANR
jgi:phosphoglucosamine mutase